VLEKSQSFLLLHISAVIPFLELSAKCTSPGLVSHVIVQLGKNDMNLDAERLRQGFFFSLFVDASSIWHLPLKVLTLSKRSLQFFHGVSMIAYVEKSAAIAFFTTEPCSQHSRYEKPRERCCA